MTRPATKNQLSCSHTSLMDHYQFVISQENMSHDEEQSSLVGSLQDVLIKFEDYARSKRRFASLFLKTPAPKGLYIWGDVGRGKSFLMDMFFEYVNSPKKRRVHFHAFMQEVHYTLHGVSSNEQSLETFAQSIAKTTLLLCFDEFQVTNIADAMIMKRLFGALFEAGVVVVATSNTAPQSLYLNGLHRDRFLPFIQVLTQYVTIAHLNGGEDYRRQKAEKQKRFFSPLTSKNKGKVDSMWTLLTGGDHPETYDIISHGRTLTIPFYARRVARFHFRELCGMPLGATDYVALAECISALILEGIPQLSPEDQDEAMRLQTLIDILYDRGVLLIASSEVKIDEIYRKGQGAEAFQRTASRLHEMCHG